MSSIAAASGSYQPPPIGAVPPPKKDRDGDNDNNRTVGDKQSANPDVGQKLNIKA